MFKIKNAKRICAAVLLAAALAIPCAACGQSAETGSAAESVSASEPARTYTVDISKDTLRRTGVDISAAAHKLGLTNVTTHDDGSCTIAMTKDERDTICASLKESLNEQLSALPDDGTWPFISKVTLSNDCRSAEILSSKEKYKPARDNAAAQAVYIPALLYISFAGEDAEHFTVHFTVKDETTGDVLGEFDYPEAENTNSTSDESSTDDTDSINDTSDAENADDAEQTSE